MSKIVYSPDKPNDCRYCHFWKNNKTGCCLDEENCYYLRQHRTMGAAGFGGSFDPIVQHEKWEIHPVFPHFPYFRLGQNLSPNLLAPLCGVALDIIILPTA